MVHLGARTGVISATRAPALPLQLSTPDHEIVDRLVVRTNSLTFAIIAGSTATIVRRGKIGRCDDTL